jgi:hypothetical protein
VPKEQERRAWLQAETRAPAPLPGAWQAVIIAGLSALLVGYIAQRNLAPREGAGDSGVSRLAEVEPEDLAAALATLDFPLDLKALLRSSKDCIHRLAWVTIARGPGEPAGRIRLQSGHYVSPAFALTDVPTRVAVPYPAPYAMGHGTLFVLGTTEDAVVALMPPWQVLAKDPVHAREVSWTPAGACPGTNR